MSGSQDSLARLGAPEPARSSAAEDMIEGDSTASKKDQHKGKRGDGKRKFIAVVAGESIVPVHFPDCDEEVDQQDEGGGACEKSHENQNAAQKLGEGRDIAQPCGQSKAGDELRMVVQASKDLMVSVCDHDHSQGQTHHHKSKGLQAIEVAQSSSR